MSQFSLIERAPQPTAVVRAAIPVAEIPKFLGHAYEAVMEVLAAQGMQPAGPPFAYYLRVPTDVVELEAGFPVPVACAARGEVVPGQLPGGTIAMAMHVGPYETMTQTYDLLMSWMKEQGLVAGESMWEVYLSDPQQEPDQTKWQTQMFWPVSGAPVAAR